MSNIIKEFRGPTRWLSNFHSCEIEYGGFIFPSTEHAYQAAKCYNQEDMFKFLNPKMTAAEAKKLGMIVLLRPDWEEIKLDIMYQVNYYKFRNHKDLTEMLLATGDKILQEGNNWGDTYWGICNGKGYNHLGKILMKIREEIKEENNAYKQ